MLTLRPDDDKKSSKTSLISKDSEADLQTAFVPYKIPSFVRPHALNNHMFEVNGERYEFFNGMYFKRVATLEQGSSFGEIALQRRCLRTASIMTETDAEFAFLTKAEYEESLMKIANEKEEEMIDFIQNLPIFKSLSRKRVQNYILELKKVKYLQGQVVYKEQEDIKSVFIVYKGQFDMHVQLPREDMRKRTVLQLKKGEEMQKATNILTQKFPDMKDFPSTHKISVFGRNCFIGEDDLFRGGKHTTTVKCLS